MTTHALSSFRSDPPTQADEDSCTFCSIIRNYPHSAELTQPFPFSSGSNNPSTSTGPVSAYVTYSDEGSIAILDILPIRRGHTLVIPRKHVRQLSELPLAESGELARALVIVSRMVGKALGDERMQVITNQVYAQVVPHLHFHIVPAPRFSEFSDDIHQKPGEQKRPLFGGASPDSVSLLRAFGHGRDELDDDEASLLTQQMREALQTVLEEEEAASGRSRL
ncbi:hypothetical protein OC861_003257 [Tilletia horrida]|nr:hypothetical protein OC861_003257 [Tilletia horrida]